MRRRGDEAEDWDGQSRRRPAPYGSHTRGVHLPDAVPAVPLSKWAVGTASGRTLPSAQTPPPENRGAPGCQVRFPKLFRLYQKAFRGSQSSFSSALAGVRLPEREPEGEALPPKGIRSAREGSCLPRARRRVLFGIAILGGGFGEKCSPFFCCRFLYLSIKYAIV